MGAAQVPGNPGSETGEHDSRGLASSRVALCLSFPGPDPPGDAPSPRGAVPEGSVPHLRSPRPGGLPSSQQMVRKPALGPGGRHRLILRGCFHKQLAEMCPAAG